MTEVHVEVYAYTYQYRKQDDGTKKLMKLKKKQVDVSYIDNPLVQVFVDGELLFEKRHVHQ